MLPRAVCGTHGPPYPRHPVGPIHALHGGVVGDGFPAAVADRFSAIGGLFPLRHLSESGRLVASANCICVYIVADLNRELVGGTNSGPRLVP